MGIVDAGGCIGLLLVLHVCPVAAAPIVDGGGRATLLPDGSTFEDTQGRLATVDEGTCMHSAVEPQSESW